MTSADSPLDVNSTPRPVARTSWMWLAAGCLFFLLADGRYTIGLASWLALICLIRFTRTQPVLRGLIAAYLVLTVTRGIAWYGMIRLSGLTYGLFVIVRGLSEVLPYLIDRLLSKRLHAGVGAFVFPTALVTLQFALSHGPQGTWGSLAYTQAENLALLQSLSIFGLWGIPFLMAWCACAVNLTLEYGIRFRPARTHVAAVACVLGLLILCGQIRLSLFHPDSRTVRIASLSPPHRNEDLLQTLIDALRTGKAQAADLAAFDTIARATQHDLLEASAREARAGAQIVFWSEGALALRKPQETRFLQQTAQTAAQNHVYLGAAVAVWDMTQPRPLQNKLVLFDPAGRQVFEYLKSHPTPGTEAQVAIESSGRLPLARTAFGDVSAAICYDTDFPALIAQAGANGTDILLSPADDWREIDPRHTQMARFRAIEQGINLVRQASEGLSAAFDYQGRTLAAMHDAYSADAVLVANVPTRGARTIYSKLGNWFAWLCAGALMLLSLRGIAAAGGRSFTAMSR